jgi:D-alanine-D-alanine ligase-like ATP-grasp enzyme
MRSNKRRSTRPPSGLSRVARTGPRGRQVALWAETARLAGAGALWRSTRARRNGHPGQEDRNAVYRRIWREAAAALEADFRDLGRGFFEFTRGGHRTQVFQQVTASDDAVTLQRALDKPFAHARLAAAGVTVPEHVEFTFADPQPALDLIRRVDRCVIKPSTGTGGGLGVSVNVADASDLWRACLLAARFNDLLLAERQASGLLHRLLLLDGELLDVVVDRPPHVVGDGRATIEQLIAAENRRRTEARGEAGLELLSIDLDAALTLHRGGWTPRTVPAPGAEVQVRSQTNDHCLEDSFTYRGELHPDVLSKARAAAAQIGLRLAGVDLIAPDVARPLSESGGVVLEVNGAPGIHRHYHVADREHATPVAVPILERMLA